MFRLGGWELIIILVIVLLLFGPGRIGSIFGELGKGLRSFRDGIQGDKNEENQSSTNKENKEK